MRLLLIFSIVCSGMVFSQKKLNLIPYPQHVNMTNGEFVIPNTLLLDKGLPGEETEYFKKQLNSGLKFQDTEKGKAQLVYSQLQKTGNNAQNDEFYTMEIAPGRIHIQSYTNQGYFLALQTLNQLIETNKANKKIPAMKIEDQPKFEWRGMHLDVCRHFFNTEEVKKYLDYLAAYKYNKFHWHLTDDQGWRIEIKKYPKLTEVGAWREGSQVGRYSDMKFDDKKYGGFYTQEQIKDVVAYAKKLHIDVIPEIEMPGHAQAALAAYPELACTEGPFKVGKTWGVMEDIFCPKEETFKFLEGVLDEVIPLFPYEYIHIGGDEAPKKRWKESKFAQDLIKKLDLKDELHLQSYFITRMEKYINSKGKQIVGWDEILEGGLAPNATVMSWTGIEGGIHAAKTGHKAIMTPTSTNYFDYYQGSPDTEPIAIGGDLRLPKVYAYNPVPKALTPEEAKYIWGTQGNLWTEYILDFKHVEHMIFPRMMALSEVAWGTSKPEEYKNFESRVIQHFKILDSKGIKYSKAIYEVDGRPESRDGKIFYSLTSANKPENIRYTTDGTEPVLQSSVYTKPILIDKTMTVKSGYFENGQKVSATTTQEFLITKSTGKEIMLTKQPGEAYATGGAATLVDGIRGNLNNHGKSWLGFSGNDIVATIDFGAKTDFTTVQFSTLERQGSWIYWPVAAKVYISQNGTDFKEVKSIDAKAIQDNKGIMNITFPKQTARFIKVAIKNLGKIPDGKAGAGNEAWLFVDEIAVN